jgi:hypothetical protein
MWLIDEKLGYERWCFSEGKTKNIELPYLISEGALNEEGSTIRGSLIISE